MKILHFITSLRTGGAERLLTGLLPRLRDRGHSVELLVMDGTRTHFTEALEASGIAVHALAEGAAAMHNPLLAPRLRRFMARGGYDITHTHNTPAQALCALVTPRACKLVTTEHNTTNRRRGSRLWLPADRLLYARYRAIVACGDETASSLLAYMPALAPKLHTVANGIDLDAFAGAAPAADIAARFAGRRIIVMAAAFRPQKDQPTLLKAMALLPDDYALVLAGEGDTAEACRALALQLGIGHRVHFAGVRTDIPALYAAADAIVLSTHHEGLSLSAIEAMASGTPLVASDVDGVRLSAAEGAILFPPGDAEALAATLHALCTNPSLRERAADAGRRRAALFDIDRTAEGYDRIYNNLS